MEKHLNIRFDTLEENNEKRVTKIEERLEKVEKDGAFANGQKTVALWVGGAMLAVLGALGTTAINWFLGLHRDG